MNDGIQAVLFDFGGVLADEGFRYGLYRIAELNSLDPELFFETARDLIAACGYLTGRATEGIYFEQLRSAAGITQTDAELRRIILEGFILRDWMMSIVRGLRSQGIRVAILSDQTDWLDELDGKMHFSKLFERIYNSYHLGKPKGAPSQFTDVLADMGLHPRHALLIDDSEGHVERARSQGLHAILYRSREQFLVDMERFFPGPALVS